MNPRAEEYTMPLEELQREIDRLQDEVRRWRRENRAHVDRVMEYSEQCDAMQAQREELRALAEARRTRVAKLEEALTTLLAAIRYVDGMGLVNPRYAEAAERALRGM